MSTQHKTTIRFKGYTPEYKEVEVTVQGGVSLRYLELVTWDEQKVIATYNTSKGRWVREIDGTEWTDIDLGI